MRTNKIDVTKRSANRALKLARNTLILGFLAGSLQGCAVWEYVFGGPAPEDMPEISQSRPVISAPTGGDGLHHPTPRRYPSAWATGELFN